jgi:SEC-C motif-containing protein
MGLFERVLNAFNSAQAKAATAPEARPARNEECWCGSGKKYKKCHLPADEKKAADEKACSRNCGPT